MKLLIFNSEFLKCIPPRFPSKMERTLSAPFTPVAWTDLDFLKHTSCFLTFLHFLPPPGCPPFPPGSLFPVSKSQLRVTWDTGHPGSHLENPPKLHPYLIIFQNKSPSTWYIFHDCLNYKSLSCKNHKAIINCLMQKNPKTSITRV